MHAAPKMLPARSARVRCGPVVWVCHPGNAVGRLPCKATWNPAAERFVADAEAEGMLSRRQWTGFEVHT